MGTTSVSHSDGTAQTVGPSDSANSIYDLIYKIVLRCPPWVRIGFVIVMAPILVLLVLRLYPPPPAPKQAYSSLNGKQVTGPWDAQMADVTLHLQEDARHSLWHDEHPADSPAMRMVFKITDDNYLGYRYYEKSDRCVFVMRRENGFTTSHWLRDPQTQSAAAGTGDDDRARGSTGTSPPRTRGLLDLLVSSAEVASPVPEGTAEAAGAMLQSAPTGCVAGTHPGEFTWWWGTPENQCWTPMFRQWKDGCKHYQRYNKCANAWDDAINWVSCSAGPHH
jgi:hypothetical protein